MTERLNRNNPEVLRPTPGMIVVITGVTAAGKTALQNEIIKRFEDTDSQFKRSILTTTRFPRPNEVPGVDMDFVTSHEDFFIQAQEGSFGLTFPYDGNWYGVTKKDLQRVFTGTNLLLVLPIDVARDLPFLLHKQYSTPTATALLERTLPIVLLSSEEERRARSRARGDSVIVFERRRVPDGEQEAELWGKQVQLEIKEQVQGVEQSFLVWKPRSIWNKDGELPTTVEKAVFYIREHQQYLDEKDCEQYMFF